MESKDKTLGEMSQEEMDVLMEDSMKKIDSFYEATTEMILKIMKKHGLEENVEFAKEVSISLLEGLWDE